jgi:hypothetical protein
MIDSNSNVQGDGSFVVTSVGSLWVTGTATVQAATVLSAGASVNSNATTRATFTALFGQLGAGSSAGMSAAVTISGNLDFVVAVGMDVAANASIMLQNSANLVVNAGAALTSESSGSIQSSSSEWVVFNTGSYFVYNGTTNDWFAISNSQWNFNSTLLVNTGGMVMLDSGSSAQGSFLVAGTSGSFGGSIVVTGAFSLGSLPYGYGIFMFMNSNASYTYTLPSGRCLLAIFAVDGNSHVETSGNTSFAGVLEVSGNAEFAAEHQTHADVGVIVSGAATLSCDAGNITTDGMFEVQSTATYEVYAESDATTSLTTSAQATLNGTLNLVLSGGFDIAAGASVTVLNYGTRAGAFTSLTVSTESKKRQSSGDYQVNYNSNSATVTKNSSGSGSSGSTTGGASVTAVSWLLALIPALLVML